MDLFFRPLACSMASRITLYEAGATARFLEVDKRTHRTLDGEGFLAVNPLGQVPALRLDDGRVLLENAAILQHLADLHPQAALAPAGGYARAQLQQWLSFIGTELHKALFVPLFDSTLPAPVRSKLLDAGARRLSLLDARLATQPWLLDQWSVADAYLTAVLNWHAYTGVELARWPALQAYFERVCARPATARAMAEERALYAEELRRERAAA